MVRPGTKPSVHEGTFSPAILVSLAWALVFLKCSQGDLNVQGGVRTSGGGCLSPCPDIRGSSATWELVRNTAALTPPRTC